MRISSIAIFLGLASATSPSAQAQQSGGWLIRANEQGRPLPK